MTNPASGDDAARVEQMPCPNPWCRKSKPALFRGGFLGRICRVQCETCAFSGPERQEDDGAAILAWNTRAAIAAMPAPVALLPCLSCGAGINEPCDLRMAGHDRTVWLNGVPDLVAENAQLKDGSGANRQICEGLIHRLSAKDAEIAALREIVHDLDKIWSREGANPNDFGRGEIRPLWHRIRAVLDRAKAVSK